MLSGNLEGNFIWLINIAGNQSKGSNLPRNREKEQCASHITGGNPQEGGLLLSVKS